ncbi:MAG TPA: dihydrofolate reductase family protein [Gemmatimonadaceae bacterium]
MRRLTVFNSVTLDGYFTGANGDLSWAHQPEQDPEWNAFVDENAKGGGTLLFGRVTYEMMVSFWPTPDAARNFPVVAAGMNKAAKVVFSKNLKNASWNNTKLVSGDLVAEVRKMKKESGQDMTILGSGSIVSQLTDARLIDAYQFALTPVVIGNGKTMFDGVKEKLNLKLTSSRTFANGRVVLTYEPV